MKFSGNLVSSTCIYRSRDMKNYILTSTYEVTTRKSYAQVLRLGINYVFPFFYLAERIIGDVIEKKNLKES